MATALNQPLSQALAPKRSRLLPSLLLIIGILLALAAAAFGYFQQQRTEKVVIALRPLQFGQQITAQDLATIEVPLHRPQQLAGIVNPNLVIGKYVTREISPNDLVQVSMLTESPPDQPVYPSGEALTKDRVAMPFSTLTVGPITHRDLLNIGFNDPSGDQQRCQNAGGQPIQAPSLEVGGEPQPYACRLITGVNVLHVDQEAKIAYIELTPEAAHAVWAVDAADLKLWGERYGSTSAPIEPLQRLDPSQITPEQVQIPGTPADEQAPAQSDQTQPQTENQP